MFEFELGTIVKDKVTGLTGVVMARTEFVHGCARYMVQPQSLHDGKPVEPSGFDEPQLEGVKGAKRVLQPPATRQAPGGPGMRVTDRKGPTR